MWLFLEIRWSIFSGTIFSRWNRTHIHTRTRRWITIEISYSCRHIFFRLSLSRRKENEHVIAFLGLFFIEFILISFTNSQIDCDYPNWSYNLINWLMKMIRFTRCCPEAHSFIIENWWFPLIENILWYMITRHRCDSNTWLEWKYLHLFRFMSHRYKFDGNDQENTKIFPSVCVYMCTPNNKNHKMIIFVISLFFFKRMEITEEKQTPFVNTLRAIYQLSSSHTNTHTHTCAHTHIEWLMWSLDWLLVSTL